MLPGLLYLKSLLTKLVVVFTTDVYFAVKNQNNEIADIQ